MSMEIISLPGKTEKNIGCCPLVVCCTRGFLEIAFIIEEERDFIDFWNALGRRDSSSVNAKFDSGEIKNSLAVYSKEQYDERYQSVKDGTMFKRYAGSTVSIGGKEYAVGEDGKRCLSLLRKSSSVKMAS